MNLSEGVQTRPSHSLAEADASSATCATSRKGPNVEFPMPDNIHEPTMKSSVLTSSNKLSLLAGPSAPRAIHAMQHNLESTLSEPTPAHFQCRGSNDSNAPKLPSIQRRSSSLASGEGAGTPPSRTSLDGSVPPPNGVRKALYRIKRLSPHRGSSRAQSPASFSPPSRSPSREGRPERPTSPLRRLQQWINAHFLRGHTTRDDLFIPVDPFKFHVGWTDWPNPKYWRSCFSKIVNPFRKAGRDGTGDAEAQIPPRLLHFHTASLPSHYAPHPYPSPSSPPPALRMGQPTPPPFLMDTIPRALYLLLLLRLPALYFARVARIFEDAEVSRPDIERMIEACGPITPMIFHDSPPTFSTPFPPHPNIQTGAICSAPASLPQGTPTYPPRTILHADEWAPPYVSPALARFKASWEVFIDSLIREWKTLNLVSALLLSTIITIFQIPTAAADPVTRTAAFLSLIAATMSLIYGCTYIVRFGAMRSMYRASKWAEEARRRNTHILWNVWVFLALPAVWMAWAMIFFIVAVLSFVWRTGAIGDGDGSTGDGGNRPAYGRKGALAVRIVVSAIAALGFVYFVLIIKTLKGERDETRYRGGFPAAGRAGTDRNGRHGREGDGEGAERGRGRDRGIRDVGRGSTSPLNPHPLIRSDSSRRGELTGLGIAKEGGGESDWNEKRETTNSGG